MSDLFGDCPSWLNSEMWTAYCAWRASLPKKQKMTPYARVLILNELSKLKAQGHNPDECLKQSLMNCWLGMFPVKRPAMDTGLQSPTHPAAMPASQVLGRAMTGQEKREALLRFKAQKGALQ